jgi:aconitate hydratase
VTQSLDSFNCKKTLTAGGKTYTYFSIPEAEKNGLEGVSKLPFSLKVLLENLLRFEDGKTVTKDDILACAEVAEDKGKDPSRNRLPPGPRPDAGLYRRARRGRPGRHARCGPEARRRSQKINPQVPVDLVIDHSVMVD